MKCTAKEFIELVKKAVRVKEEYYSTPYPERVYTLGPILLRLYVEIDEAEITDICNLETNEPLV